MHQHMQQQHYLMQQQQQQQQQQQLNMWYKQQAIIKLQSQVTELRLRRTQLVSQVEGHMDAATATKQYQTKLQKLKSLRTKLIGHFKQEKQQQQQQQHQYHQQQQQQQQQQC